MLLLAFQTVASWNMHHDFGASSERRQTTVTLRLAEDGTLTATDTGYDRFHNLHRDGRTSEEATEWTSAWSGTWTRSGGELHLSLTRTEDACTQDGVACPPLAPAVSLVCRPETIPLSTPTSGWRCTGTDTTLRTAAPWLFVEGSCVSQVRGRFSGNEVSACDAAP